MLTLIESSREKTDAQRKLVAALEKAWRNSETRVVAWRPRSLEMRVIHNAKYWLASDAPNQDDTTPRYWNSLGQYHESGNLHIAVEINIPTSSNSRRVSGFFAKDRETGVIYLMHDGGVGGGKAGVGRTAFLAWSDARLMPVVDSQGSVRPGIIVAQSASNTTARNIGRFVQQALDFKQAVTDGYTVSNHEQAAQVTYKDYYDEFAGSKRRRRVREVEYISRHGDIVRALRDWRQRASKVEGRFVKNAYIDLGIQNRNSLTELYEVKTNCDRQTLYSAIGQIFVYDESQIPHARRFLVLPTGEQIPDDVGRAFKRADISVICFDLTDDQVRILGRFPG